MRRLEAAEEGRCSPGGGRSPLAPSRHQFPPKGPPASPQRVPAFSRARRLAVEGACGAALRCRTCRCPGRNACEFPDLSRLARAKLTTGPPAPKLLESAVRGHVVAAAAAAAAAAAVSLTPRARTTAITWLYRIRSEVALCARPKQPLRVAANHQHRGRARRHGDQSLAAAECMLAGTGRAVCWRRGRSRQAGGTKRSQRPGTCCSFRGAAAL